MAETAISKMLKALTSVPQLVVNGRGKPEDNSSVEGELLSADSS